MVDESHPRLSNGSTMESPSIRASTFELNKKEKKGSQYRRNKFYAWPMKCWYFSTPFSIRVYSLSLVSALKPSWRYRYRAIPLHSLLLCCSLGIETSDLQRCNQVLWLLKCGLSPRAASKDPTKARSGLFVKNQVRGHSLNDAVSLGSPSPSLSPLHILCMPIYLRPFAFL